MNEAVTELITLKDEGEAHHQGDNGKSEEGGNHHGDRDKSVTLLITYNGVKKPVKVQESDTVATTLAKAIAEFGQLPNPHMLSLCTIAGAELADNLTIKQANLRSGDELLLRPSQVKGGAA